MTINADANRVDVSLIVAATDSGSNLEQVLAPFREEIAGRGELIVIDGSRSSELVPDLWARGLEQARCPLVAFSTSRMRPLPGWLDALVATIVKTRAAAVGGPIVPGDRLSNFDRAVYLHRFAGYRASLPGFESLEPPGDNAIFSRSALAEIGPCGTGTENGFWEVAIHRELKSRGLHLAMAPDAVVEYQGGERFFPFLSRRIRHARQYAAWRANNCSTLAKTQRLAFVPLVPLVLLARALRRIPPEPRGRLHWLAAIPTLTALLAAWTSGETLGTLQSLSPKKTATSKPAAE